MGDNLFLILLTSLISTVIGLVIIYFIIKSAVLAALEENDKKRVEREKLKTSDISSKQFDDEILKLQKQLAENKK